MKDYLIFETEYWKVILNPRQAYLGRCIVVCKQPRENLSAMDATEWEDLRAVINKLETAAKAAFNATMFNWTCLMNDAYKQTPPTPQVHWHFRPRYQTAPVLNGVAYPDPNFAHHYDRETGRNKPQPEASPEVLEAVAEKYRATL